VIAIKYHGKKKKMKNKNGWSLMLGNAFKQVRPKISAIGFCLGQTLILGMPHSLAITLHFYVVMCAPRR